MENEVIKIKPESSWTSSESSSDSSSSTLSDLYYEAIKLGKEEEKFYTALDCAGHSCLYKRTSEGFFILGSGYVPPYEIYEEPIKLSEVEIQSIFTDYRSHGYHYSREITKEAYEEEVRANEMIKQNFHIHSTLSGCASKNMFIKAIIVEAEKCSMSTIAIVDHIDNPKTRDHRGRQLMEEYRKIRELKFFSSDLHILLGCEITQTSPNTFSVSDEIASEMDIVLVSCNHYHLKYVDKPPNASPADYADHYLSMVEGALNWKYTNIIAHPFHLHKLKWIDHVQVLKNYDINRLKTILSVAADKKIAFELCPRHLKNHLGFFTQLLHYGRKFGTKFSIGADAHKLSQVCYESKDLEVLEMLGIKKEDLWGKCF